MRIIDTKLSFEEIPQGLIHNFNEKTLFFDIETTGLSKKYHSIYLIGCMFVNHTNIIIRQYFCDTTSEENIILDEFVKFCSGYDILISFNGDTFDLPFIEERLQLYALSSPFEDKAKIDLYKIAKKLKHWLKLPNLKQKNIEHALGYIRSDIYTGGELIEEYFLYEKEPTPERLSRLIQHNYDDMLGMLYVNIILNIDTFNIDNIPLSCELVNDIDFNGNVQERIIISGEYKFGLLQPMSYARDEYYLSLQPNGFKLLINIIDHKIKIPYSDYKNYVYLPYEDIAIPKALATAIAKEAQKKCNTFNCYGKQEVTDAFLGNKNAIQQYTKKVFNYLKLCPKK